MKILTILGTRPEIIRLSRIIARLDKVCDHKMVYTGQNYDPSLSDIFFQELGVRAPDYELQCRGSLAEQLSRIFVGVENILTEFRPDAVLILGDTNSALAAIVCERMMFPVYHMEAGNRCFDLSVPEEKNRRLVDSISSVNLPYTHAAKENLLREGVPINRIWVTGNPIKEVIDHFEVDIDRSSALDRMGLEPYNYVLVTAHRAENVDDPKRLTNIMTALREIAKTQQVVFSCHPRTAQRLGDLNQQARPKQLHICEPFGFFDFVKLEKYCAVGITDSGTVQEELCLFGRPAVTIRQSTERPETVWCGSNIVSGLDVANILAAYQQSEAASWKVPEEYDRNNVSQTVVNILLGHHV